MSCHVGWVSLAGLVGMYFQYHANVCLRLKPAVGFDEFLTMDGCIHHGCSLSMALTVVLSHLWCQYLESLSGVTFLQLYANNL